VTPLKWVKTKDGGCKADDYLVELVKDDTWRLVYLGKVLCQGTRDACKSQVSQTVRLIASRPKAGAAYTDDPTHGGYLVGPPGTTVGAWKTKNETGSEFLLRMAKAKGHCPSDLLAEPHVVRDMGIDLADYPSDEVRQLDKEAFPLAQQWAKAYNDHPGAIGMVDITYHSWFRVSGNKVKEEDRRFVEALARTGKADVPDLPADGKPRAKAVGVPKGPREPAGKDDWGFRVGTGAAQINTGITAEWKTAERIAKDSGSQRAVHGHLVHLLGKNLIELRGEGKAKEYRRVGAPEPEVEAPKKKVVLKKKPK
jgi:hypothetical protein